MIYKWIKKHCYNIATIIIIIVVGLLAFWFIRGDFHLEIGTTYTDLITTLTAIGTVCAACAAVYAANEAKNIAKSQQKYELEKFTADYSNKAKQNLTFELDATKNRMHYPFCLNLDSFPSIEMFIERMNEILKHPCIIDETSIESALKPNEDSNLLPYVIPIYDDLTHISGLFFGDEQFTKLFYSLVFITNCQLNNDVSENTKLTPDIDRAILKLYAELSNGTKKYSEVKNDIESSYTYFKKEKQKVHRLLRNRNNDALLIKNNVYSERIYKLYFDEELQLEQKILNTTIDFFPNMKEKIKSKYPDINIFFNIC